MNRRRILVLSILTGLFVFAGITQSQAGNGWSSYPNYPQPVDWTFDLGTYDCAVLPPGVTDIDVLILGGQHWRYKLPRKTLQVTDGYGQQPGTIDWIRRARDYVVAEYSRKHGDICTAGFRVRVNLWQEG